MKKQTKPFDEKLLHEVSRILTDNTFYEFEELREMVDRAARRTIRTIRELEA